MSAGEENLPEESESEDEDYLPGRDTETQDVSEEEEDRDGGKTGKGDKLKRSKVGGGRGKRKAKRRQGDNKDSEESDDEEDVDFVVDVKELEEKDDIEDVEDPEVIAAREKVEKARTDSLWADFLSSVETSKLKKQQRSGSGSNGNGTKEKIVTKVYNFAGEKVEVKEKVRVKVEVERGTTDSRQSSTSTSNPNGNTPSSSNGNSNGNEDSSTPSSSSLSRPPRLKISFLSGDPADIGLAGDKKMTAKEGLANVLNAMRARNKKLGTLEKSKLDWESYKNEQNIQEELAIHNRSKNGFIDKQEFLQRADLRQFEIEKDARTKRRRNP